MKALTRQDLLEVAFIKMESIMQTILIGLMQPYILIDSV